MDVKSAVSLVRIKICTSAAIANASVSLHSIQSSHHLQLIHLSHQPTCSKYIINPAKSRNRKTVNCVSDAGQSGTGCIIPEQRMTFVEDISTLLLVSAIYQGKITSLLVPGTACRACAAVFLQLVFALTDSRSPQPPKTPNFRTLSLRYVVIHRCIYRHHDRERFGFFHSILLSFPPNDSAMSRSLSFVLFAICYASFTLTSSAQQLAAVAYTPQFSVCPKGTSLIRLTNSHSQTLSSQEAAFVGERGSRILPHAWSSYLQNVKDSAASQHIQLPGYVATILSCISKPPQLAIATSGGGHRAAIFGAGVMAALDGRNSTSASVGTGGLLQASSYLAGLSGGSWLVGSLTEANFPTFPELIFGSSSTGSQGWLAQFDLTEPSSDPQVVEAFIGTLVAEVAGKFLAGFPITINDVWARTLSRHFVSGTTAENFFDPNVTHGAGKTLSGLADVYVLVQIHQFYMC